MRSIRHSISTYMLQSLFSTTKTGLWQCLPGWSSISTPLQSATVSRERWSTAHLQPTFLGPHLQCSSQPPLASVAQESIMFKVVVIMFKTIHGLAPKYLSQLPNKLGNHPHQYVYQTCKVGRDR